MPFCPQCKDEYDSGVAQCAECQVDLVDGLASEGGDDAAPPREVKLLVASKQVGETLVDLLHLEGVEATLDTEEHEHEGERYPAIKLSSAVFEFVAVFIARTGKFEVRDRDPQGAGVVDFYKPTAATVRSHPLMKKKPKEVLAMGEADIPELGTLLKDGEADVRHWATRRLLDFNEPGIRALESGMFDAVGAGNRELVFAVIRVLDEAEELGLTVAREVPDAVTAALGSADPAVRGLAALVTGRLGGPENVARLIPLLGDTAPHVLEEVVEALDALTGIDAAFGEEPSAEERAAATARFQAWLAEQA